MGYNGYSLTPDELALVGAYAIKGTQLAYSCTYFDAVICCAFFDDATFVRHLINVTGYAKGAIYQKLKCSQRRGVVKMVSEKGKRPIKYVLTEKGLAIRTRYREILADRMAYCTRYRTKELKEMQGINVL